MISLTKHKKLVILSITALLIGCTQTEPPQEESNATNTISQANSSGNTLERLDIGVDSISDAGNGFYDLVLKWSDIGIDTSIYDYLLSMHIYKDTSMAVLDTIIYRTTKLRTENIEVFYGDSLALAKAINSKLVVVHTNKGDTIELIGGNDIGCFYDNGILDDLVFMKTVDTTDVSDFCNTRRASSCDYIAFGDTSLLWLHNNSTDTINVGQFEHFNIYQIDEIKTCLCDTNNLLIEDQLRACIDTLKPMYYSTSIHHLPASLMCEE